MKFAVVFAAASLAVVSAANCDIAKLATVAGGPNAKACEGDSGYKLVPPTAPTAAILTKLCASKACTALLGELKAAAPAECTIALGAPIELYAGLLDPISKACAAAPTPTTAPVTTVPATTKPGATTAAPGATTAAPTTGSGSAATEAPTEAPTEEVTEAPVEGSTEGSAEASAEGSASETPVTAPATTTAVPSPTSSASTIAAAAGAVFAAVVASLF